MHSATPRPQQVAWAGDLNLPMPMPGKAFPTDFSMVVDRLMCMGTLKIIEICFVI
jgi:hypothetical protein